MALKGILIVDKPAGWTSNDVVAKIRRASGRESRVGHAGTLDPMATGVMVVMLGSAVRLAEYVTAAEKRYRAEIVLGAETDTYDATGEVVDTSALDVNADEVVTALRCFEGEIEQRPPPYSAVMQEGRRAYQRARGGEQVSLPMRRVTISDLRVVSLDLPRVVVELTCSKGTYVRSIAHDLGQKLGCGAHLAALRRLSSGRFSVEHATPLVEVIAAIERGDSERLLLPTELGAEHLPRLELDEEAVARLRNGATIEAALGAPQVARAHAANGDLVAIVECRDKKWWPKKVLV